MTKQHHNDARMVLQKRALRHGLSSATLTPPAYAPYILLFFPKVQKGFRKWTKKMSKIQKGPWTFAKNIICYHK